MKNYITPITRKLMFGMLEKNSGGKGVDDLQAAVKRCQIGNAKLLNDPDLYETINMSS
jgi:hypothetical protein